MDGRQQCRFVCLYYLLTISLRSSARQELEMDNQQSYLIHSQLFYSIVVEKPRAFPWNKSKKIVLVSKILMTHLKKMLQLKSVDLWRTLIYHVRIHDILCLPATFHHASHRWYRVHFNHILSLPATLPHASCCNLRRFRSLSCSSTLIFVVVRNSLWYQLFYFLNLLGKCLVCKFFYAQLVKGQSIWYQRKARFIKKKIKLSYSFVLLPQDTFETPNAPRPWYICGPKQPWFYISQESRRKSKGRED